MADVFVSYSRRDSEFVRRVTDSISERGKEVWLDTEGIADGEVFPEAIKRAIEQSDAFLFVITPDSVHSPYCGNEVEYARQMQKRILPVLRSPVPDADLPAEIRDRNWIPFVEDSEFDPSVGRLVTALDTDVEASRAHTRWLVKALEWNGERRDPSFLLRGAELNAAEAWLAASPAGADPTPTPLQREYLLASRTAGARRQRRLMGASLAVAVVSIGLLIFALISRGQAISSRGQAVSERISARAQALAAESQAQLPNDPEISLILGMRAVQTRATPQSEFALRAALDASPLDVGFPSVNVPGSCSGFLLGISAAYSPNGQRAAEAVCNGTVRLLDPADGRVLRTVHLGRDASSVAYSPDGSSLAVGTFTGVALLDPRTGAVLRRLSGTSRSAQTLNVVFSPNGRMIAATSPAGLTVWALPGGRPQTLALTPAQGFSLAFSPDGRELYTGGYDGIVRVYDVGIGREIHQIQPSPVNRTGGPWPLVVAVSHDGRQLAIGYPDAATGAGIVSVYSASTWRREFDVASIPAVEIQSLAFSPDDTSLAVGAEDGTAGVWSLISREQLAAYDGPTAAVDSVSFSPDGSHVLTASGDGFTRVWRATGTETAFVPMPGQLDLASLHGDTLEALLNSTNGAWWLEWWQLPSGRIVRTLPLLRAGNDGFASLSPDGRLAFVASVGGSPTGPPPPAAMTIVNAATGQVVRRLGSVTLSTTAQPQFSPDDSKLLLEELPGSKVVAGPGSSGRALARSQNRLEVLTLASGHAVTLADPLPCGPGTGSAWAFSGDGQRVAQESFCGIAEVWDADNGHLLRTVNQGAETSAVALNHDGSELLVSSWDSRATIWSVATGRPLVQLIGDTRGIADAALSPDGTRVITGSLDHTVRVWDAVTGQVLRVLTLPSEASPVFFSTDGSQIAAEDNPTIAGVPGIVHVYETCPACENPSALLKLAAPHATTNLTKLESTVVSGS
jgi:WD40 repeat protein